MQLRWYVELNGDKRLEFKNDDDKYWSVVDVKFEFKECMPEINELQMRIRELEGDYKALIEARK